MQERTRRIKARIFRRVAQILRMTEKERAALTKQLKKKRAE